VVDYLDIARRVMRDRLNGPAEGAAPAKSPKMDTDPPGAPWADWKAAELNRLFQEQGVTGQPGGITAATILHGERRMNHDETKQGQ
jgi:hypothetical protein